MIRTIIIMATRTRTCHTVSSATFFTCHNRFLARDFMCDSCVYVRWFILFSRIYFFCNNIFFSRRTIKWRIIQLTQSGALISLWSMHLVSAYMCTWVGRWMYVCQKCISLIAKEMIYETRMNEILRMYNSKVRLQLYWFFCYVSVLMMGRAIDMSRGSIWFLSRQIIDNVKKEIIITFQFKKIIQISILYLNKSRRKK